MNCKLSLVLFPALLFAACGNEPTHPAGTHVHADGTVHKDEPAKPTDDHAHGAEHPLGEVTVGGHKVQIVVLGDIEPGKEADFDVRFPAGSKRPETLRAWIGVESGLGSMKTKFGNEGDTVMHGHVEVPKPIPADSLVWIEIESSTGTNKASVALR